MIEDIQSIFPIIQPLISLVITLVMYTSVIVLAIYYIWAKDEFQFSNLEKTVAIISLISFSLLFPELFIFLGFLMGCVYLVPHLFMLVEKVYHRYKLHRLEGNLHRRPTTLITHAHPTYPFTARDLAPSKISDEELDEDSSDLELVMDLTEED